MKKKIINNFLIIKYIGNDDRLALRINKDFFIHNFDDSKKKNEKLVSEILNFLKIHGVKLDKSFSVIVNQGPGSFSGIRTSLAIAKGLEISTNIQIYGYNNTDLQVFDQENIEKLLDKKLIEKKLIKPIYLS